ncbi:hypothetical protein INT47_005682 [Mucor saturninus]|uniref:Uncharacterized protein n=1 Tax=Mucor saturninus TaxID=64648 RepID=A0A8H7QRF0_9FUNG|nr:hypothetical protein INT47_005682 [Mucor saturninus]
MKFTFATLFAFAALAITLTHAAEGDDIVCIQSIIECPKECSETCIYPDKPCPKTYQPTCPIKAIDPVKYPPADPNEDDEIVCIQSIIPCPEECSDTCEYPTDVPCPKTYPPRCPDKTNPVKTTPPKDMVCTADIKLCPKKCRKTCIYPTHLPCPLTHKPRCPRPHELV